MSFLATLTLLATLLPQAPSPQGGESAAKPPLLSAAEQVSLRDKLAKYLADDISANLASDKERDRASRARDKSREAFDTEWRKAEKKGNLLGSMADLRGVFEACFLVKAPAGALGALRAGVVKDAELKYHVHLPKAYKADKPWRTVIVLPGSATAGSPGWVDGPAYFAATWDKAALTADTIFHLPGIPGTVELDPVPDYSREGADEEESKRIQAVFGTFREVMLASNVDRSRVFADFGRDACGFGLRFMTLFPDRWAGAVLRAPVAVDDIRLGTLTGIPILLLRTAGTAAVVDGLKERLEAVSPGAVTVLEATDEYPHKAATPQIEEWMGKQRRSMTPKRVVVEPNHNRFNRAYWVDIDTADSLLTVAPDKKPRIEAVADRAANRITVKTVGVESFTLFLNDDLVDLDQEFTVVVNDKAQTEKRTRSFRELRDQVISRNDWDCLYPVKLSTSVSKQ